MNELLLQYDQKHAINQYQCKFAGTFRLARMFPIVHSVNFSPFLHGSAGANLEITLVDHNQKCSLAIAQLMVAYCFFLSAGDRQQTASEIDDALS